MQAKTPLYAEINADPRRSTATLRRSEEARSGTSPSQIADWLHPDCIFPHAIEKTSHIDRLRATTRDYELLVVVEL
jgi:hypothetical protein